MTGKRIYGAILLLLMALVNAPALSGDVLDRVVERGEIRVGMTGAQPPLNMYDTNGELMGFEVDLVNELAASMEVELTLITKPFLELLPALEEGQVDMIVSGMTITPRRNTRVAFVGPYALSGKSLLTRSASLATVVDIEELNDEKFRITALKGSTSQDFVEKLLPKAKASFTDDYTASVQRVLDGQADAMIADSEICQVSILLHPEAELKTTTELFTVEPIGIALPKNDPLMVNLIENYFYALDGIGLVEALYQKWYDDGSWIAEMP
jgi:polar amino acid transport system substrate-binding protein